MALWWDPEVLRWARAEGGTIEDFEAGFAEIERRWQQGEQASFMIVDRQGRLIGGIELKFYAPERASISYTLAPSARGRGIATAALRAVCRWSLAHSRDLVRLELWIQPGNDASEKVAQRAGFQREGVLRSRLHFGGELRDVVSYSLLRDDLA